jgi:histone H3
MAGTKQTARKSAVGKAPCMHLATKGALAAVKKPTIAVRKPHRWRPGTVALREIQKIQKNPDLLIRKAPFQCLVREILQANSKNSDMRMWSTALLALQEATEYFMVDVLSNTNLCAMHGNRVTMESKDLALACRIRGIEMGRA